MACPFPTRLTAAYNCQVRHGEKLAELEDFNKELAALWKDKNEEDPRIAHIQSKIDKLEERPKSWGRETLGRSRLSGSNGKVEIVHVYVRPEDQLKTPAKTKTLQTKQGDGTIIETQGRIGLQAVGNLPEQLTTHRTGRFSCRAL